MTLNMVYQLLLPVLAQQVVFEAIGPGLPLKVKEAVVMSGGLPAACLLLLGYYFNDP